MVHEFKNIHDLVKAFPTEADCIKYLEAIRWNGNPVSPFDPGSKVYKCSGIRYKCKNTGKYFNAKAGTIFEDTKIPLIKWFMALYVFLYRKNGISSHQLARYISVTQKSAWFILHRLRYAFGHPEFREIAGEATISAGRNLFEFRQTNKINLRNNLGTPGNDAGTKNQGQGIK